MQRSSLDRRYPLIASLALYYGGPTPISLTAAERVDLEQRKAVVKGFQVPMELAAEDALGLGALAARTAAASIGVARRLSRMERLVLCVRR